MKKLAEFKQWLEISEAAAYLSEQLEEEVSEKDVYRLALDKQIKLGVSTMGTTFAKKIIGIEGGKNELGEEIHLPSGEWEFPMVGGNPDIIRFMKLHSLFAEPPEGQCLIFENCQGEQFSPLELNDRFQLMQAYRLPQYSTIVVKTEELSGLIRRSQNAESVTCKQETVRLHELPEDLKIAIRVYYEFWHDRPENKNKPTTKEITAYLQKKHKNLLVEERTRIIKISKHKYDKKGGAPSSERSNFKGISAETKENIQ